jgi:cell wall-associated NlpC family hydrolase
MKWLIGIVTVSTLSLTGCVTPSEKAVTQFVIAETVAASNETKVVSTMLVNDLRGETSTNIPAPAMTSKVIAKQALLAKNAKKIKKAVKALLNSQKKHRTWYVFSGASPSGWDCSGLTLWTYQQIGVELPHRASEQANVGIKVKRPKYGDIVVFKYKGYSSAYHVGIYLSKDKMIDAPMPGTGTSIESISKFGGGYSNISYVRVLEN